MTEKKRLPGLRTAVQVAMLRGVSIQAVHKAADRGILTRLYGYEGLPYLFSDECVDAYQPKPYRSQGEGATVPGPAASYQ